MTMRDLRINKASNEARRSAQKHVASKRLSKGTGRSKRKTFKALGELLISNTRTVLQFYRCADVFVALA
jgi:hypothetical protein